MAIDFSMYNPLTLQFQQINTMQAIKRLYTLLCIIILKSALTKNDFKVMQGCICIDDKNLNLENGVVNFTSAFCRHPFFFPLQCYILFLLFIIFSPSFHFQPRLS